MNKKNIIIVIVLVIVFITIKFNVAIVASGSMLPDIKIGEVVIIYKSDIKSVVLGDIICYTNDENIKIMHRVVEISDDKESIRTKGDANKEIDEIQVTKDNYIGKVLFTTDIVWKLLEVLPQIAVVLVVIVLLIKYSIMERQGSK